MKLPFFKFLFLNQRGKEILLFFFFAMGNDTSKQATSPKPPTRIPEATTSKDTSAMLDLAFQKYDTTSMYVL